MSAVNLKENQSAATNKTSLLKKIINHWKLGLFLLLLFGYLLAYIVFKRNLTQQQAIHKIEIDSLISRTNNTIYQHHKQYLKNVAMTLSWAIRSELLKNNYEQPSLFINQLIKEEGFQEILIANKDGLIILSTNKKFENTAIKDFYMFDYVNITEVKVLDDLTNHTIIAIAPILGLNVQLATLIITCKPKKIN